MRSLMAKLSAQMGNGRAELGRASVKIETGRAKLGQARVRRESGRRGIDWVTLPGNQPTRPVNETRNTVNLTIYRPAKHAARYA